MRLCTPKEVYPFDTKIPLNLVLNRSENSVKITICYFRKKKSHIMIYLMNMIDALIVNMCTLQCAHDHYYVKV